MDTIIKAQNLTEQYFEEDCYITEIVNSDEFPTVSVSQAKVKPNVATVSHRLKDTDEKYYILSGTGKMEVGGKVIGNVQQGDMVIIPKDTYQRITNIGSGDLVFLCICTPRFEIKNYEAN